MPVHALKEQFQNLPSKQFVSVWECIEEIDAALDKAGPTALLALNYVRAVHEERLATLLGMQQARIDHMTASAINQHENVAALATSRNAAWSEIEKLKKRVARLTKKAKSKA